MAGREHTGAILAALADLTSGGREDAPNQTVIPLDWFRWVPLRALTLFGTYGGALGGRSASIGPALADELGAADSVPPRSLSLRAAVAGTGTAPASGSLRAGWLWLAGTAREGDRITRLFTPLLWCDIAVRSNSAYGLLEAASPVGANQLLERDGRWWLIDHLHLGGGALSDITVRPGDEGIAAPARLLAQLTDLRRYALEGSKAAGFPTSRLVPAGASPADLMASEHVAVVAGVGVWSEREATDLGRSGGLRSWSRTPLPTTPTAFEQIYLDDLPTPEPPAPASPAPSPFVLDRGQRAALEAVRRQTVTVISGSPGTGKSHLLVAVACDALARGERVLVAARSDDAVDALTRLLERAPGPTPVVFGDGERRHALSSRLAAGRTRPAPLLTVEAARRALDEAVAARNVVEGTILAELAAESTLEQPAGDLPRAASAAPALWEPGAPLEEAAALLSAVTTGSHGFVARHRAEAETRRLRTLVGAPDDADLAAIAAALTSAREDHRRAELAARGGPDLADRWTELEAAEETVRDRSARWLAEESRSEARLDRRSLPAVAAVATSLRAGRAARRQQLARIDGSLTRALPLWVGSLPDIDDLLPAVPDLFDLVLIDEASSIDQPLAAPALMRAPRAVIAGDPQQLRHTSFTGDASVTRALDGQQLGDDPVLASRLDVRRNSLWDVAAGAAPVVELDEHHRSVPHLISFVTHRLYDDRVGVATRSPGTATRRAMQVHRVGGRRGRDRVVAAEVGTVRRRVLALRDRGERSVGVVSPFRAQADALQAALDAALDPGDAKGMELRVGTVHGFQGNERDVVVVSLGVGDGEDRAWSWVEDPHLFAVMATRARERMEVVVAGTPPAGGLVEGWLAHAAATPTDVTSRDEQVTPWVRSLARDLRAAGQAAVTAYPVGRDTVDVVVGDAYRWVAVHGGVHPDGEQAHIERHLALRRSGWEVVEAWPTAAGTEADPVVDLLVSLDGGTARRM